jgi:predicted nucleotide-binding protein
MRPRILIGSSSEALPVANALQMNLDRVAECTVWNQGVFSLSKSMLEALIDALARVDYAVFVLNDDDVTTIRGESSPTTRDNVIFELGLAIGALGRSKTFMVIPRASVQLRLPTDLLGITAATYQADRQDRNLRAALGPAAMQIQDAIGGWRRLARGHSLQRVKDLAR